MQRMNSVPNGGNLRSRVITNLRLPDYCMVTELKDDYNQKLRLNPNCTNSRTFVRGCGGDWMMWRSQMLPLRSQAAEQPREEPQVRTFFFGKISKIFWEKSSNCSQLTGQSTTTARFIHGRFYGNESFHFPSILRRSPLSPTLFIAFFFHRGHERSSSRKSFWLPWKKITSNGSMFGNSPIWDSRRELLFSPGFRKAHWICNG